MALLRVLGAHFDRDMISLFGNNKNAKEMINATIEADSAKTIEEAYIEIHKKN